MEALEKKTRCQSCGMPLGEGSYGTLEDGSLSGEYCQLCFERGVFTEPNLTVREMIARSMKHMMKELHMPEEQADVLANSVIPMLHRWQ